MGFFTLVTAAALVAIAGFVKEISKEPTVATPAALTVTTHPTAHASPRTRPSVSRNVPEVNDVSSGLSYRLLASPWQRGCPADLNTQMFSWTAGENTVAGLVDIYGTYIDWHGDACSGLLQDQFTYSGPGDLESVTMSVADALEPVYYGGLQYDRTIEGSSAITVSGHQAWEVTFLMTYPEAANQGLAWTSEAAAVVVVDRGAGQAPAVFYTSVPSNLGTSNVAVLVSSLRLNR
jgi:hypothetical protein